MLMINHRVASQQHMYFGVHVIPIQMSTAQHGILNDIRRTRASLVEKGLRLVPVHFKGHAGDNTDTLELTPDEVLNVRMDLRAKAFWLTNNTRGQLHGFVERYLDLQSKFLAKTLHYN